MFNEMKQVAVKTESIKCRFPQLLMEFQNTKLLVAQGFPKLHHQGILVENENIFLIIELMGPTLEDLFNFCGRKFSLKTSLMIFK